MADLDHLDPPAPRSTENWTIPKVVRIEGDGIDPAKTALFDDATGEKLTLPISSLRFEVDAGMPNRMEITLASIELRATVHHVHYQIEEDELRLLAKQNGYRVEKVPAYPARMSSYGPTEIQITFRDFPDMAPVIHRTIRRHEAIEAAEGALFAHIDSLNTALGFWPDPSEPQEGEFLIWAHEPDQ